MKKFNDLDFGSHPQGDTPSGTFDSRASMFFDNGYGVSVITGDAAYTDDEHPYEVAILEGTKESSYLTYDTPVTDDVVSMLDESGVTDIMRQTQELQEV